MIYLIIFLNFICVICNYKVYIETSKLKEILEQENEEFYKMGSLRFFNEEDINE